MRRPYALFGSAGIARDDVGRGIGSFMTAPISPDVCQSRAERISVERQTMAKLALASASS
jgi:hypothetical protein